MSGFGIGGGNLPHDEDGLPSVPAVPDGENLYGGLTDLSPADQWHEDLLWDVALDTIGAKFERRLRAVAREVGWLRPKR